MSVKRGQSAKLAKSDFETLSAFRYQMRLFEYFSENAARAEGITPLQYLLLLHIKGFPGRDWASIGELAERLKTQQHGVVALVSRCETAGLVQRSSDPNDRRQVQVHLLPAGETILNHLAALHRAELKSLDGKFAVPVIDYEE